MVDVRRWTVEVWRHAVFFPYVFTVCSRMHKLFFLSFVFAGNFPTERKVDVGQRVQWIALSERRKAPENFFSSFSEREREKKEICFEIGSALTFKPKKKATHTHALEKPRVFLLPAAKSKGKGQSISSYLLPKHNTLLDYLKKKDKKHFFLVAWDEKKIAGDFCADLNQICTWFPQENLCIALANPTGSREKSVWGAAQKKSSS